MKCGTTSLHDILASHPDVFIPRNELFFFDIDDVEQHPDFFVHTPHGWTDHDFEAHFDAYLAWYAKFFQAARPGQILGEDSTTYIASAKTPERIARLLPRVKIIIMLRDPASRAYSQYWHLVRTGRAVYSFENCLQYTPGMLIQRSLYQPQIEKYLSLFPPDRIKIVLFEEFVQDMLPVVLDVCRFLGVHDELDVTALKTHRHPARLPRSVRLQLLRNLLLRSRTHQAYTGRLASVPNPTPSPPGLFVRAFDKCYRIINPLGRRKVPPMKPATREFLNKLFARENAGLSKLIGKNVEEYWYR